jgi:hypothetical protein
MTVLITPGIIYAAVGLIYGVISVETTKENRTIVYCNPPRAYAADSRLFWNRSNLLLNALVIITYGGAYYTLVKMREFSINYSSPNKAANHIL